MYPYHKVLSWKLRVPIFQVFHHEEIDAWESSGKELIQIGCIDLQAYLSTKVDPKIVLTPASEKCNPR